MSAKPHCIDIPDTNQGLALDLFTIPHHYKDAVSSVLISHGQILDRVEKLAQDITRDVGQKHLIAICVLKGGHQFFADLLLHMKKFNSREGSAPLSIDFIRVKSYHNDQSTGTVTITGGDLESIRGKEVLIVEDIIDTGKTMTMLLKELEKYEPAKVRVASLLVKRTHLSNGYVPDYVGFSIPDKFVVGYALDYNEWFRDLDHICIISDVGKTKYAA
ncbi:hypoxanthine phosphoribosyltransferase [Capsaspora owczarzaki ATCC 30864]|uniref:hypoxanthine phosphoribosyltransferase n=1 Tax=Capsaspora owczarzaki (strain ATCC 30864) TaxID=595528 RepID=UPI0003522F5F|nr:hypoxanthine phosphoribosyltransferase [Capsaspora owczarzaki ATCC 30864]|eukprot:XP_004344302.2 hypoxanthine phosphoribosyltransferase [Capsaspora owczarzaki ATCC 30864]